MKFMVHHVQTGLQKQLTQVLYREHLLEGIMREREDIAERRHQCQETIVTLSKAVKLLDSIAFSTHSSSKEKRHAQDQNTNTLN
jgi:hypothetical protein